MWVDSSQGQHHFPSIQTRTVVGRPGGEDTPARGSLCSWASPRRCGTRRLEGRFCCRTIPTHLLFFQGSLICKMLVKYLTFPAVKGKRGSRFRKSLESLRDSPTSGEPWSFQHKLSVAIRRGLGVILTDFKTPAEILAGSHPQGTAGAGRPSVGEHGMVCCQVGPWIPGRSHLDFR